jgi:hypothetical protein
MPAHPLVALGRLLVLLLLAASPAAATFDLPMYTCTGRAAVRYVGSFTLDTGARDGVLRHATRLPAEGCVPAGHRTVGYAMGDVSGASYLCDLCETVEGASKVSVMLVQDERARVTAFERKNMLPVAGLGGLTYYGDGSPVQVQVDDPARVALGLAAWKQAAGRVQEVAAAPSGHACRLLFDLPLTVALYLSDGTEVCVVIDTGAYWTQIHGLGPGAVSGDGGLVRTASGVAVALPDLFRAARWSPYIDPPTAPHGNAQIARRHAHMQRQGRIYVMLGRNVLVRMGWAADMTGPEGPTVWLPAGATPPV